MESNVTTHRTKDEEQRKALNNWALQGFIGSIIAGTGFGKSRCGVVAVSYVLNKLKGSKALILVPTTQLQDQFAGEFHKWGHSDCLDRVDILCYQSAYKLQKQHYDIVICDEVHLGLSKEYRKFFINNKYERLLCMTATPPEEEEYKHLLYRIAPVAYHITLDECVELGLVSPYEIHCIPIQLTVKERRRYQEINKKFVEHKVALNPDAFNFAKIALSSSNVSSAMKAHAIGFYDTIRQRKEVIDSAEGKVKKFQEIVLSSKDKRIISFGGINKFTDRLAESVTPLAEIYHSKRTTKQKKKALRRFKEGEINVLCSTKALNQGFDIPNANLGIICGLTSKSLSMIQRVGRLIRFEEGKVGKIYVLYVEDSQEEKWLKNSVYNLKNITWH